MIELSTLENFNPPSDWIDIQTIEAHTGGEPLRVILSGFPALNGASILSRRKDLSLNHSMISLGSCTMKLNAASEMFPLSSYRWNNLHPFVPISQAGGYQNYYLNLKNN